MVAGSGAVRGGAGGREHALHGGRRRAGARLDPRRRHHLRDRGARHGLQAPHGLAPAPFSSRVSLSVCLVSASYLSFVSPPCPCFVCAVVCSGTLDGHEGRVTALCMLHHYLISVGVDQQACLWDANTGLPPAPPGPARSSTRVLWVGELGTEPGVWDGAEIGAGTEIGVWGGTELGVWGGTELSVSAGTEIGVWGGRNAMEDDQGRS
eukprot:1124380-Rhodomonas_salina.1